MPNPAESGDKNGSMPPVEPTGEVELDSTLSGPPPEDSLVYEDDEVIEQDGVKMVPLEALVKVRREHQAAQQPPVAPQEPPPVADEEPPSAPYNWDTLVPDNGQQQQQQFSPEQFGERFRDMMTEDPWSAVMWAVQSSHDHRDRLEGQARKFVPDYGNLPVHEVSQEEVQALAQNPIAMRALLAKVKGGGQMPQQAPVQTQQSQPPPQQAAPAPQVDEVTEIVKRTMAAMANAGRQVGMSGEGTGGPGVPTASPDEHQLDQTSVDWLKSRGRTDEEIKAMTGNVLRNRRKKGLVV